MSNLIKPNDYKALLDPRLTEQGIKLIKEFFQQNLSTELRLRRVTAPLFVLKGLGINDDLNGVERPVTFPIKDLGDAKAEVVHSLAKWKRLTLAEYDIEPGYGIYTDMNAIRADEELDNLHSLYVDQWDWEAVITREERTLAYLKDVVERIYAAILRTEYLTCETYGAIKPFLPRQIHFIHSEELLQMYPDLTPKEREDAICKKYGAVFIIGIGGKLSDGKKHDGRAPDYDDWSTVAENGLEGLNGDILIWYPVLGRSFELSSMDIRLKWWKNYTFNMAAVFATYAYELDKDGHPYVGTHTEWGKGRFGRFQGTSQNISFTLTPEKLKKLFGHGDDEDDKDKRKKNRKDDEGVDTDIESNVDDDMIEGQRGAKKSGGGKAETDEDGYMMFKMPWSLTFGYGITMRENTQGKFNTKTMRYPYKFTQTLNVSGNVRISDGWNISFSSGYDFEFHKMSMTTASLQRDLHCFNMSCQVVLAPYTSYNFTFRCNAATLTDALKYDKRSGYSNAVQWY